MIVLGKNIQTSPQRLRATLLFETGSRKHKHNEEAIQRAIAYCIPHDIMKEFLEENGSEVENMLYTEWDWDKALDIAKEESYAVGEKQGFVRGQKEGEAHGRQKEKEELICKFSKMLKPEEIAKTLDVPLEYVHSLLASEKKES